MTCPHCKHSRSRVVDSRQSNDTKYRRRECSSSKCGKRFSTFEIASDDLERLQSLAGTAKDCARIAGEIIRPGGGL